MDKLNFYSFEYFPPFYNMKIDNYFLRQGEGFAFRLYGWQPYGVSIGFSQKEDKVCNVEYCKKKQIDIVRRVTGGGAVYHKADITYMLSFPLDFYKDKSITGIYGTNAAFIMSFLKKLGIDCYFAGHVEREVRKQGMAKGLACFLLPSDYEILVEGKKIIGNALRVEKGRVLQHGSIAFDFDYSETAIVLNTEDFKLKKRVISLKELNRDLKVKDAEESFSEVFKESGFKLCIEKFSNSFNL